MKIKPISSKHNICILIIPTIIVAFIICGCKDNPTEYSRSGFAFDTVIEISVYDGNKEHAETVLNGCFEICNKYDQLFNINNSSGDIYKINHSDGKPVNVSSDTLEIIEKSIYYSEISDGLFDITIEPIYELWNIQESEHSNIPSEDEIKNALQYVDYHNIKVSADSICVPSECKINLGAVAKGYIADKIKEYLIEQNINSAIINLGGNIVVVGSKPDGNSYNIGIQQPFSSTGEIIKSIGVMDQSVVTSGIYQRYFEYNNKVYHHIINPYTGYPVDNELNSVSVICNNSVDADAYSTICMLMGYDDAIKWIESIDSISVIFIDKDNKIIEK